MAIGSSIELIWHFAGYLHLTEDYVASRVRLDEIHHHYRQTDFRLSADEHLARAEAPADMSSLAVRVKYSPGPDDTPHAKLADFPDYHPQIVSTSQIGFNPEPLPHFSGPTGSLSIGQSYVIPYSPEDPAPAKQPHAPQESGTSPAYESSFVDGGNNTIADLSQTNIGNDRDHVTDTADLEHLPHVSAEQPMGELLALSEQLHGTMTAPAGADSVEFWTAAVVSRDESLANGTAEAEPIAPGRYVNGELQPAEGGAEIPAPASQEPPVPPVVSEGSQEPGQVAETGANKLVNIGTILDVNEAPSTLVVGGNYYETNAILQTNILQNHDMVFQTGDAPVLLDSPGSTLDNVANFIVEDIIRQHGYKSGPVSNLTVNIDYVDGDVMDVKSLTQRNYFDDGDVSVQTRFDSYSEIHTGGSTLANVARFADWGKHYDVIIVVGDYHSANIISQTNVVLDNDVIGVSSTFGSMPSAHGGQNVLENEATIAKYGATAFSDIDRKLGSLIDDLKDRDDLDHNAWSNFYGASSGSLNVLFVTGNYYDLNIISQINVLADADLAIQLGSSGFQWLSTGGNSAINEATIVNAGGLYQQHLGGDLYEDSILFQANLISEETGTVTVDPTALVSELVAFMDYSPDHDDADAVHWNKDTFCHGDTFGHVLT